jgi:predicted esterase
MPPSEHHLRVHRTARFYRLGTPGARTKEIWICCHGYGQLAAAFARALEPLQDESDRRVVIVPEALNRFYLDDPNKRHGPDSPVGATWMTREDRERDIDDNITYLDDLVAEVRRDVDASVPIIALGFSQGVATVCRWAVLGRTGIQQLILWAGTLPTDLPSGRGDHLFRGATVTMVVGNSDSMVPAASIERDVTALVEQGIAMQVIRFDGGHALKSETLRALAAGVSSGV